MLRYPEVREVSRLSLKSWNLFQNSEKRDSQVADDTNIAILKLWQLEIALFLNNFLQLVDLNILIWYIPF